MTTVGPQVILGRLGEISDTPLEEDDDELKRKVSPLKKTPTSSA